MHSVLQRFPLIDISEDDDLSTVVDFGYPVKLLWIYAPTITSSAIGIEAAMEIHTVAPAIWEVVAADVLGADDDGDVLVMLDDTTPITGFQHFRLTAVSGQAADREFILCAQLL